MTPGGTSKNGGWPPEPATASGLRHIRLALVPHLVASPAEVEELVARPADRASWYGAYRLVVKLRGGDEIRLFLKDFGSYRARKPDMIGRREREYAVYRHLSEALRRAGIEVPRFYGAVWHQEDGRWWLLLEDVPGESLRHLEFQHWLEAARALGRVHRTFEGAGPRLVDLAPVRVYDAAYFREIHQAAVSSVRALAPAWAGELEAAADRALPVLDRLAATPRTLVHGAYVPINILVDPNRTPARVCPLDWELTGVGSGLYDLAFLVHGFRGERLAEMWRVYRQAAGDHLPRDVERVRPTLDALQVHKLLTMLDGAEARDLKGTDVAVLVRQAVEIAERGAAVSGSGHHARDERVVP